MTDQLKYPEWQESFRNAITAFGTQQLREKLQKVETMILDRLQALSSDIRSLDRLDERQALLDAISIMRVLNRDKMHS
jgi:hypothetical protein